jgi:hypothetical protein
MPLPFDDTRWLTLTSGRRTHTDVRPLLKQLETSPDLQEVWDQLWDELVHQGDIGTASLVSVAHLVRLHLDRQSPDWNVYLMVSLVELRRGQGENPDTPAWAAADYQTSISALSDRGLLELPLASDSETKRAILGLLAITHQARVYGRVLAELSEDEVEELLRQRSA